MNRTYRQVKPFSRLSVRIGLVTSVLIILVILIFYLPLYWYLRGTLEENMESQMRLVGEMIREKVGMEWLQKTVMLELPSLRDSLEKNLTRLKKNYPVEVIFICSEEGAIVATSDKSKEAEMILSVHFPLFRRALSGKQIFGPVFSTEKGKWYKTGFFPLAEINGRKLFLGINASANFLRSVQNLNKRMFYLALIVLAAGVMLSVLFSFTITKPLRSLERYAHEIGKGKYSFPAPVDRKDEIGFLADMMKKMSDQLKRREKENKMLVASVAHEIRNPLAGMKLNLELLSEELKDSDMSRMLERVRKDLNQLIEIVEDFLAFAQPLETFPEKCSIREIVSQAFQELKGARRVELIISGAADVYGHRKKLFSLFRNMLKNALEASDSEADIKVNLREEDEKVIIRIVNRGKSIPEEIKFQIFEPFVSGKPEGVGLGLSIAKSVVEQHGGSIRLIESNEEGTVFEIILPAGQR